MPDIASAASSATPWGAIASGAQTLLGLGQTIFSGKKKAERNLEKFADSYTPNQSILDYYNKALAKYSPNPYSSIAYQNRNNAIQRNLTTGIGATQDRHGALGSISSLVQNADDANANAAGQAEAQQNQNLSQLGNATNLKAGEDNKKFDLKYNLLAAKAGGANATKNAGINNIFGGLNGMSEMASAKQLYGDSGGNSDLRRWKSGGQGFNNRGYATGVF